MLRCVARPAAAMTAPFARIGNRSAITAIAALQRSRAMGTCSGSSSSGTIHSGTVPSQTRAVVVPVERRGDPLTVALVDSRPLSPPRSRELVVAVSAAAINPIDTMMCGGYGRDLVSLAQQISAPQNSSASCTGADSAALSLGREGVGEIVALGPGLWAQGSGSGGEWALGQRVWFSPRIAANQGALSGHVLLTPGEVAPAPEDLPDPEAASYPFAVSTAWTALVDCAGVQPAPLPASAAKFAKRRRGDAEGLDSPLDMLKAAGQQGLEMLGSLPLPGAAGELASRLRPVNLSPSAPRRALVHGASGAVGLVAVQLLQRWGWEVWATTTPATRSSLDKLQQAQAKAALTDQEGWGILPPFHIVDTAATVAALSATVQPHSLSLFLDGVGGDAGAVLQEALGLLAPSAQFVTLRGEGVAKIDRQGFLQGAISGGTSYAQCKSRAAECNAGYHWAISAPSATGMAYVSALVRAGLWARNLQPVALWRGLDAAPHALQRAHDEAKQSGDARPRHVVLIKEDKKKE